MTFNRAASVEVTELLRGRGLFAMVRSTQLIASAYWEFAVDSSRYV